MTSDFYERVIQPSEEGQALLELMGGRPEIEQAAELLHRVIDETREDISSAELASRFPRHTSEHFDTMTFGLVRSSTARALIDAEGEAGAKKAQLLANLSALEFQLGTIIGGIVSVRADLRAAKTEF